MRDTRCRSKDNDEPAPVKPFQSHIRTHMRAEGCHWMVGSVPSIVTIMTGSYQTFHAYSPHHGGGAQDQMQITLTANHPQPWVSMDTSCQGHHTIPVLPHDPNEQDQR
jgi:hypothetical protein